MAHQNGLFELHGVHEFHHVFDQRVAVVGRREWIAQPVAARVDHVDVIGVLQLRGDRRPGQAAIGHAVDHQDHLLSRSGNGMVIVNANPVRVGIALRPALWDRRRRRGVRERREQRQQSH